VRRLALARVLRVARLPVVPELRADGDAVALGARERVREDRLASPLAVGVRRVEERHALIERAIHERCCLVVAVMPPPSGGEGPDTEPDLRDLYVRARDLTVPHASTSVRARLDSGPQTDNAGIESLRQDSGGSRR